MTAFIVSFCWGIYLQKIGYSPNKKEFWFFSLAVCATYILGLVEGMSNG